MNPDCFIRRCHLSGRFLLILTICILFAPSIFAQTESVEPVDTTVNVLSDSLLAAYTPAPATEVDVSDTPNDAGGSITIGWQKSVDDTEGGKVKVYKIERAEVTNDQIGEFAVIGDVVSGAEAMQFIDGNTSDDLSYYYRVVTVNNLTDNGTTIWEVKAESAPSGPVESSQQWFDLRRINVFVGVFVLCLFIVYYINQAKAGKKLFIRKIAGLDAVDEAVGRATEMGKKIFYIPGTQDMDNVQTIAGVTILGRVAEMAAQYETWLEVPVSRSLVLVTAKEIVKEAYAKVGRPDAFPADDLALMIGAQRLKRLEDRPNRTALTEIAELWRPWRGPAALLLWHYYSATKR